MPSCLVNIDSLLLLLSCCLFFIFKQKTAYELRISDWSSDVCSSDLGILRRRELLRVAEQLSGELGLPYAEAELGQKATGTYRRHVDQIGRASCRERV